MPFDPETHHRRSIRLKNYDYAQPGAYFVTLCVENKAFLLGEVADGQVQLTDAGTVVESWWNQVPGRFRPVELDAYVLMPNHLHGVLMLSASDVDQGRRGGLPLRTTALPGIVHWFKSGTTADYRIGVEHFGWRPLPKRLWQRNYYEHVVRDERDLNRIREYIAANPFNWHDDPENPEMHPQGQASAPALPQIRPRSPWKRGPPRRSLFGGGSHRTRAGAEACPHDSTALNRLPRHQHHDAPLRRQVRRSVDPHLGPRLGDVLGGIEGGVDDAIPGASGHGRHVEGERHRGTC